MENYRGRLGKLIDNISEFEGGNKYSQYIELRKKGLKKQAQIMLNDFLVDLNIQDVATRRDFLNQIYTAAFISDDYNLYLPFNLNEVLKPEIHKWIIDEPNNPIPYRWSYDLNLMKKSLQLDPYDEITLDLFSKMLIAKVSMNQHEVASGFSYNGDPNQDLYLIDFYEKYTDNIQNFERRDDVKQALIHLKECAILNLKNH